MSVIHGVLILSSVPSRIETALNTTTSTTDEAIRWHERMGHAGIPALKNLQKVWDHLKGVDFDSLRDHICEACYMGKAARHISRTPVPRVTLPLQRIWVDVVGPIKPNAAPAFDGCRYVVIFTDDCTRKRWAPTAVSKAESFILIKGFNQLCKNHHGKAIGELRVDGGREHGYQQLAEYCLQEGIILSVNAPYTPEQMGTAEISNRVVIQRARTMMLDSGIPFPYWPWAIQYSVLITNSIPAAREQHSPDSWFSNLTTGRLIQERPLDLDWIKRFGSVAYVTIDHQRRVKSQKFAPNASKGWFVGYKEFDRTNARILFQDRYGEKFDYRLSPHVSWDEKNTYKNTQMSMVEREQHDSFWLNQFTDLPYLLPAEQSQLDEDPNDPESGPVSMISPGVRGDDDVMSVAPIAHMTEDIPQATRQHVPQVAEEVELEGVNEQQQASSPPPEAGQRPGSEPTPVAEARAISKETQLTEQVSPEEPIVERPPSPVAGEKRRRSSSIGSTAGREMRRRPRLDYKRLNSKGIAFTIAHCFYTKSSPDSTVFNLAIAPDPTTFEQAMNTKEAKQWKEATDTEVRSLFENKSIELIELKHVPKGVKLLKGRWVFKTKLLTDGSIDKYRARWVAKGFSQQYNLNYAFTFASTLRGSTARTILSMTALYDWELHQMDAVTAFLNPAVDFEIYMELPHGYFKNEQKVAKVLKGLYGLKQAAYLWFRMITKALIDVGLKPLIQDVCCFTDKERSIFVLLYVDDLQITGPSKTAAERVKKALNQRFKMKQVETSTFLGVKIQRDRPTRRMWLSQAHYIQKVLMDFSQWDSKPAVTPLETLLAPNTKNASQEATRWYQSAIGALQYAATVTRPDITFAVNHLARFLTNPSDQHLLALERLFRYLKGTWDMQLPVNRNQEKKPTTKAYSDADFAQDPFNRKSHSGTVILLNGLPIVWRSKQQTIVTTSSTEAEYVALRETTREVRWFQQLLDELGIARSIHYPMLILEDNKQALALLNADGQNGKRSKHVDVQYHYVRDRTRMGHIRVEFVPTAQQLADGLTKPLDSVKLKTNNQQLGLLD